MSKARDKRKAERVSMAGVTGGAGDVIGIGVVSQRVCPPQPAKVTMPVDVSGQRKGGRKARPEGDQPPEIWPEGTVRKRRVRDPSALKVVGTTGLIVAEGSYCALPEEPLISRERFCKGDVAFGDWSLGASIARDHRGEVIYLDPDSINPEPKIERPRAGTWHRADRLGRLLNEGTITPREYSAGQQLARYAERAGKVGFKCTLGAVKVDQSRMSYHFASEAGAAGNAAFAVARAMALLGGQTAMLGGTVWLVAVCGVSLRDIETNCSWRGQRVGREQAMGLLRGGLEILARCW